jgi:ATP-dependent Clp protease ATP-binding subunit ClpX
MSDKLKRTDKPGVELCPSCYELLFNMDFSVIDIRDDDYINLEDLHSYFNSGSLPPGASIMERHERRENLNKPSIGESKYRLPKPEEIHKELDKRVIGQTHAKKMLSVAAYNHLKRLRIGNPDVQKSNVLILGPTGCGKTLLAQTLSKTLNLPMIIADASSLTSAGYVGEDVDTIIGKLLDEAKGNKHLAETGIIFIDEIDKKKTSKGSTDKGDIGGEKVQHQLLKLIEGTEITVKINQMASATIDTSNILFICSGSFAGIEKIIEKRIAGKTSIGFGKTVEKRETPDNNVLREGNNADLIEFGLIPELVGRLPIKTCIKELELEDFVRILTEPEDSLVRQYSILLKEDDAEIQFTKGALKAIAKKALDQKLGARGLRAIMEDILLDVSYKLPSIEGKKKVSITVKTIKGEEPKIKIIKEKA